MCVVDSWPAAVRAVAHFRANSVIVDVEPTVAVWGSDAIALEEGVARVARELATVPDVRTIVFLTNSSRPAPRPVPGAVAFTYCTKARKPWRIRSLRALPTPVAVVGDQILTDGLLAYRLAAVFVHLPAVGQVPWWPRLQALSGRAVRRLLFKNADRRAGDLARRG